MINREGQDDGRRGRGQLCKGVSARGARSVVVSLWEVASDAAVEYMRSFYSHIKSGKSRAEALQLARKEIKAKIPQSILLVGVYFIWRRIITDKFDALCRRYPCHSGLSVPNAFGITDGLPDKRGDRQGRI